MRPSGSPNRTRPVHGTGPRGVEPHPVDPRRGDRHGTDPQRTEQPIRILLVERRGLFRQALAMVLSAEADLEVGATFGEVGEAMAAAGRIRPDVFVLDIDLLANRADVTQADLWTAPSGCALLVLADASTPGPLRAALASRALGLVNKNIAPSRLAHDIRRVGRGERVIDPTLAVAALCAPPNPLSNRERQVLRVAASGKPATEIADQLHLTVGTIRNYVSTIMRKTGARNRTEAVRIATDRGWLA